VILYTVPLSRLTVLAFDILRRYFPAQYPLATNWK
jgi:hypothetical protein